MIQVWIFPELFRKAGEYHITINRTQEHYEAPIVCCERKYSYICNPLQ